MKKIQVNVKFNSNISFLFLPTLTESGKAIPNPQIIGKLERKLGCKLPRPGKSKAGAKAGAAGAKKAPVKTGVTRGGPPKRR